MGRSERVERGPRGAQLPARGGAGARRRQAGDGMEASELPLGAATGPRADRAGGCTCLGPAVKTGELRSVNHISTKLFFVKIGQNRR